MRAFFMPSAAINHRSFLRCCLKPYPYLCMGRDDVNDGVGVLLAARQRSEPAMYF